METNLPSFVVGRAYMPDIQKEKEPIGSERVMVVPEVPTVESPRKEETPLEVESWITKIEKRFARIPQGQPGAADDQVVVQQPASRQPPVKLSVTNRQMQVGKKAKTDFSIAWLVTWAIRQIKVMARLGRKVELQELPEMKE